MENKTLEILVSASIMFLLSFLVMSILGSIRIQGGFRWEYDLESNIAWTFLISGLLLFGRYHETKGFAEGAEEMAKEVQNILKEKAVSLGGNLEELEEMLQKNKKNSDESDNRRRS